MLAAMSRTVLLATALIAAVVAALAAALPASALDLERRRMLNAAESAPWRGVGRINVVTPLGDSMCTGTLIAEDLVLTAAHCVIDRFSRRPYKPDTVSFVAGWRLGQKVAESKAKAIAVHPGYNAAPKMPGTQDLKDIGSDMALIRLARPIPAARAAFFHVAEAAEPGVSLTLISYRRDRPDALTRQEGCNVVGREGPVLELGCEVIFGASGSALFAEHDGQMEVVAVLSAMGEENGRGLAFAVAVDGVLDEVRAALK
jgi:protease YdgD